MNEYTQVLSDKGVKGYRIKKLFLVFGFLHFVFGLALIIFFLHIYWTWAIFPLLWSCIGFAWGSLAYLFTNEYKYVYRSGEFVVFRRKSYGKYKELLRTRVTEIAATNEAKGIILTNCDERIGIRLGESVYIISPDDYLKALLLSRITQKKSDGEQTQAD